MATKAAEKKTVKPAADDISIEINQSALSAALDAVAPAKGKDGVIPCLEHVRFEVKDGDLFVALTSLDVWLIERAETVETIGSGRFLVPFKRLRDFTARTEGQMTIKAAGAKVIVRCGKAKAEFQTLNVNDFPNEPTGKGKSFTVEGEAIARALKVIGKTYSTEESRYALAAVNLEVKDDLFIVVATDGHRVGYAEMVRPSNAPECAALIPKDAIPALVAIGEGDEVKFLLADNHVFASTKSRQMIARLGTGQFPNFRLVLDGSKNHPIEVKVSSFAALNAIGRISAACEVKSKLQSAGSVVVTLKKGSLKFKMASDVGIAEDSVNVEYDGEPMSFCLNRQYLADALAIADEPILRVKSPDSQVELVSQGDQMRALHIVMTMRMDKVEGGEKGKGSEE
ncbi:MAG: hypothetical protein AB7U82_27695 [Blastocatellales bacterium]